MKKLKVKFAVSSEEYHAMVFHRNIVRRVEAKPFSKMPPKEDTHFYMEYEFDYNECQLKVVNLDAVLEFINEKIKNKEIEVPNDCGDLKAIFIKSVCLEENGIVRLEINC